MEEVRRLRARIEKQDKLIAKQRKRISALEAELAKARKNSSTSSKPPSSDIVKPPRSAGKSKGKGKRKGKRKKGGQPGHAKHGREPFSAEEVDEVIAHVLSACPDCGNDLLLADEAPRIVQQAELVDKPIRVEEHRAPALWCASCGRLHYARLPVEVQKGQLAGPSLTALVAYLKGACHASFSTIRKFVRDVLGLTVSRGYLRKLVAKVSNALKEAYDELLDRLPTQDVLNVDETGHKDNGDRFWTWCFRSDPFTVFRIDKSRGSQVLIEVLGEEFDGVLGCDYFSAYRKFMGDFDVRMQFCLAHLIRDVRFLQKLDKVSKNYAERVLDKIRALFRVIHRRDCMTPTRFQARLEKARDELLKTAKRPPPRSEASNIAKRFRQHGKAYFEFITTPGVAPTNNLAEQAIRFVVIDRKVTQGTRSPGGREWCERIWTTIATCAQQGRSVFEFLHAAVTAAFQGRHSPSLLPDSS
ncbi:IS66 family transposase [Planctomycetota bacterium]